MGTKCPACDSCEDVSVTREVTDTGVSICYVCLNCGRIGVAQGATSMFAAALARERFLRSDDDRRKIGRENGAAPEADA